MVDALTTETQMVTARPDGSFELTVSALPVRVERGDVWVPVNSSLVTAADGMLAPAAAAVPVEFSPGGSGAMARVQADDGTWVELLSPFGALPSPVVDGDTAIYREVLPGVSLHLSATVVGLTQVLEIATPQAAQLPALDLLSIPISTGSLVAKDVTGPAGGVIWSASGEPVLQVGSAFWWDSSAPDAGPDGPGGAGGGRPVASALDATSLKIDVDSAADTAGIKYPIYVDPFLNSTRSTWAYVDSAYPTTSYFNGGSSDGVARVGYINAALAYDDNKNHTTRSYFKFDVSGVAGKEVTQARFDVNNIHSSSCTATATQLYVSAGEPTNGTTWNTQPGTTGGVLDTRTFAHGYNSSCPASTEGFNALGGIQMAQASNWSTITFKMQAANEASNLSWKKFSNNPTLTIEYNTPPPPLNTDPGGTSSLRVGVCQMTCSPVPYIKSNTPTFYATPSDTDGDNLTVDFEIYQSDGQKVIVGTSPTTTSGNETSRSFGPMGDGYYTFRARGHDRWDPEKGYGSWSAFMPFVVDTTKPAAPSVTLTIAAAPITGSDGPVSGETTWNARIAGTFSDGAKGYVYATTPTGVVSAPETNLTCGQRVKYFVVVCPSTAGDPIDVSVTAVSADSTFTAWTFDAAGNVNQSADGSQWGPPTSVPMKVGNLSPAPSPRIPQGGHLWFSDELPVNANGTSSATCASRSIPDKTLNPAIATPLTLTSTGACWESAALEPRQDEGPIPVLTFDGVGGGAVANRDPAFNTADSFSVGAWVNPLSSSGSRTILAQYSRAAGPDANYRSIYYLQISSGNQWRFCVALQATVGSGEDCATLSATVTYNTWTFVTAGYDRINQRVWIRTGLESAVVSPHSATTPTASGKVTVGHMLQQGNWFKGKIYQPFYAPGVLYETQTSDLSNMRNFTYAPFPGALEKLRTLMDGQFAMSRDAVRQGPGGIYTAGWTIDGDTQDPTDVHVYVDGSGFVLGSANQQRVDVGAVYPWYGSAHGFSGTVPYAGSNGTKSVCIWGINKAGPGTNYPLCANVSFSNDPYGAFESASYASGKLTVSGWTIDPNSATSIPVHIYVDGAGVGNLTANGTRTDVGAAYPGYGNAHGFNSAITTSLSAGSHSVCMFGINDSATPGTDTLILCRNITV